MGEGEGKSFNNATYENATLFVKRFLFRRDVNKPEKQFCFVDKFWHFLTVK